MVEVMLMVSALRMMAERKWIRTSDVVPLYILVYASGDHRELRRSGTSTLCVQGPLPHS